MSELIDRQAAIDALKTDASFVMFDDHGNYTADGLRILEVLTALPSAQHYDEWCTDCKEYDQEHHCCPRWNRVIKTTLADVQPEQRWIPCSERLPSEGENVLLCDTLFGNVSIGKLIRYNTSCCWK